MTESPDVIIGEVLPDEKADGKKKQLVPRKSDNVAFGSFITKSNDLIQRTKYSLPRNEQKILFMMLSKIDQRHDMDASKYIPFRLTILQSLPGSMRWTAVMQIICAKPLKTWKTGCSGFPLGMISTKRCRGWTVVLSSIWRKRRSACALTQNLERHCTADKQLYIL